MSVSTRLRSALALVPVVAVIGAAATLTQGAATAATTPAATTPTPTATPVPLATPTPTPVVVPQVAKVSLYDADADQPISGFNPIRNGATFDLAQLPTRNLNFVATTAPAKAGSVIFILDGVRVVENTLPYSYYGDNAGDFTPWSPLPGKHVLRVTAYSGRDGTGTGGTAVLINFTITDSEPILLPPWPTTWSTAGAPSPEPRIEQAATVIKNKIYAFGGLADAKFRITRTYASYDMATEKWTTLGNLPDGMAETHIGIANDGSRYVYLMGGFGGDLHQDEDPKQWISDRVYRYDTLTNTFAFIATMPQPRGAGGAFLLGRELHYISGNTADRVTNVGTHYVLNLDTGAWRTAAPLPDPKDHFSTIKFLGKVYVLGGEHGHDVLYQAVKTNHVYDPLTDTWTRIADLPIAKSHDEDATFTSNGTIVMAGGKLLDRDATANVVSYDPVTNRWTSLPDLPEARQGTVIQRYQNKMVFTLGGPEANEPQTSTLTATLP